MIQSLDVTLFRLLNESWANPVTDFLARQLQHSLPGLVAGAVLAAFLLVKDARRAWWVLLAGAAAVIASDVTCSYLIKPWAARVRPSAALDGVRCVLGRKSGFGFPSNHAANLAAAATVLGFAYPRWAWAGALAALFVGYTRVYAGVHYPGDVLGGFAVGFLFGCAAWVSVRTRMPDEKAAERKI